MDKQIEGRKKILIFITELAIGGAQEYVILTINGLNREKYELHLMSSPDGEWGGKAEKSVDKLIIIPNLKRDISPINDLISLFSIIRILRRENYLIIHTHSSKAGFLGRVAGKIAKIPIIIHTVHGFSFNEAMSSLRKRFYIFLENVAARFSDCLITVSELNKKSGIDLKIAPPSKFVNVYNGFDLKRYDVNIDKKVKKMELGLDPNFFTIGMVARLSEQKAPQHFVEAALQILEKRKDIQFLLVGDGPLRDKVKKMINNNPKIKMIGNRDDVPEIMKCLDIYVLSSLWEGLCRTLVEAMLCSLPIIATSVDGTPEVIEHGKTGLLVPTNSPSAIADAIIYLIKNSDKASLLGESARKKVSIDFSLESMITKTENLYDKLLREKVSNP